MDSAKVVDALKATLDPSEREKAEEFLIQVQKIIGFCPIILQAVMSDDIPMPVRQAGVLYLKNMIGSFWDEQPSVEVSDSSGSGLVFTIHEQDRHFIREHILEAIIHAPEVIRSQLGVCLSHILKYDFPGRWPTVVDKISFYLHAHDGQSWMGALFAIYQLVKNFEYKKPSERKPLTETMKIMLPTLYARITVLLPDESQESVTVQKLILKIFFALIQFSFSLDLMSKEHFAQWMELARQIAERPVPPQTLLVEEDERAELVWWKCKKWAVHLLHRIFERYGSPGSVASEYQQFADFYLKTFTGPTIQSAVKLLKRHAEGEYIAPRVLHELLMYLNQATGQAFSWKFLKSDISTLIETVIFPLMCHSQSDQQLWQDDPEEYVRTKFDIFEEVLNPVHAASQLLVAAMKRKDVLNYTIQTVLLKHLNNPEATPVQKDGALHMVGCLAPNLLKKKLYKNEIETMLRSHVLPQLISPVGFLRARACWCIREFAEANFRMEDTLSKSMDLVVNCLLTDGDLPVRVEAAMAINALISEQERAAKLLEQHIRPVVLALLKLIGETENDDLTTVMQKLIEDYMDHIIPIAVEIAQGLANVFSQLLANDEDAEHKALAAMGVLNTLESILDVMEEHKEVMIHLESIVLNVIGSIMQHNVMDFYEEVLSLIYSLICSHVSEPMWQVFSLVVDMFNRDGVDYFSDMMPALYSYATVDTDAFLSVPERLDAILSMCRQVLTEDIDEDAEMHAAKLLEVVVLQCRGKIDRALKPITEIVTSRLTREIKTSELRTMCLQVLIAMLHYNPVLFMETLKSLQPPDSAQPLFDHFVKQWILDTDCFLGVHDRKMCILGMNILMRFSNHARPAVMEELAAQILPSCVLLFDGLQRAYEAKAQRENKKSESEDEEEDSDIDDDALGSDEDEIDIEGQDYLQELAKTDKDSGNDEDYSDDEDESVIDETVLENYDTPLDDPDHAEFNEHDEFVGFKNALFEVKERDPEWYQKLVSQLTPDQEEKIRKIFAFADQRKAAAESKKIEVTGGYQFNVTQVPSAFNF